MRTVGRLCRSHKSRLRRIIDSCKSNVMIIIKRPKEIDLKKWKSFVEGNSSPIFKEKIKKFKNMRSKQVFPYIGSRQGYARLENDMEINALRDTISKLYEKKKSAKPSSVARVDVSVKAHTKANSEPSNEEFVKNLLKNSLPLISTPPPLKDDMFSQVLGPEQQSRERALGFGVTPTKLGIISQTTGRVAELVEQLATMMGKMEKMSKLISKLIRNQVSLSCIYHNN
ncbi:hypothetical protein GIB67_016514 [Kingdonia uniflora]|uniref:Uncharacterized protein n=1 Tax=Kingdonia uniflora TaxID=39325 RepID=A0A7J7NQV8_9MAGN|nr:hypothetical protein GIB67_016514 [Kingdonia uniflora]